MARHSPLRTCAYGAKALEKHQLAVLVFVTKIVRLALTIEKTPDSAAAHTGFSARECKCCSQDVHPRQPGRAALHC